MIQNYFLTAFRHIKRHKLYAAINVLGLAIGMACCLLIWLYIQHERSYDKHLSNLDQLHMVVEYSYFDNWNWGREVSYENPGKDVYLPQPLKPELKRQIPEIIRSTRYSDWDVILKVGKQSFSEEIFLVDPDFIEMFQVEVISGVAGQMLSEKSQTVLTRSTAKKYFGERDPIGEIIEIDIYRDFESFQVVGVVEDNDNPSNLPYGIMIPCSNRPRFEENKNNYNNYNWPTIVEYKKGTDLELVKEKVTKLFYTLTDEKLTETRERFELGEKEFPYKLSLFPIDQLHFSTDMNWSGTEDPQFLYILAGLALLILLIACFNYISLALARSSKRMREVGMRKVLGASPKAIWVQFWGEAQLFCMLAVLISLGLVEIFLPPFNAFVDRSISMDYFQNLDIILGIVGIALLTGLLAGAYPAYILARFHPSQILKSQDFHRVNSGFSRVLVTLQYGFSAFLIISTIVMWQQMNFVNEKSLGYNKDHVITFPTHTGWNAEGEKRS